MTGFKDSLKIFISSFPRLNKQSIRGYWLYRQNKSLISKYLPEKPIILEAGAHNGSDTVEMAKMWPGSVIYAFEPVPSIFKTLTENTGFLPNVKRYQIALSDSNGTSQIFLSEGTSDASSSLLAPKEHLKIHPTVFFNKKISVKTKTLDSWAEENGIQKIDFMWLDLQGMEYKVLKRSNEIFPKLKLLYTEVNLKENYEGVPSYSEYKKWLIKNGMKVVFENFYWNDMGNALFVRDKSV